VRGEGDVTDFLTLRSRAFTMIPRPSRADIPMTQAIIDVAKPL